MPLMKPHVWSQFAILLCSCAAVASPPERLFDAEDVLSIELRGPLQATMKDKRNPTSRKFVLTAGEREFQVSVKLRGNSRIEACRFRPLRLDFSATDTNDSIFEGQDKLKLVTHCRESDAYEQNVLEEYAAYRIFAMLSEVALRTRLLKIRYIDTEKAAPESVVRYGFLIESEAELAARTGGKILQLSNVNRLLLNTRQSAVSFAFQYLIGNTDWGLMAAIGDENCCHNGIMLDIGGSHYYVPYDFDQAGLVNARYAKPAAEVRTRSVRTRRYRGYCIKGMDEQAGIEAIEARKQDILELVAGLPGADDRLRKSRMDYLQEYFDASRNPGELAADFRGRCL
jgi:hypothetical protein